MRFRHFVMVLLVLVGLGPLSWADESRWWNQEVEKALVRAKDNRKELEAALHAMPKSQRAGLAFLISHMPEKDLLSLKADFLRTNCELAYRARTVVPWGKDIPEDLFLNDVLPYANLDEKRHAWRQEFFDLCLPLVKDCKTPGEGAQKINSLLFKMIKVRYSTQRRAANQSPMESIAQGLASCSGLSIILSDACRSVCIPARLVGTPLWANKRGNHTWVEVWDQDWHFTGAAEQDPSGLDRGWFVGDAAQAVKDSTEHAIYAASFRKTGVHFPLVWNKANREIPAVNVTDRYTKAAKPKVETVRVMIRVLNPDGQRVVVPVVVSEVGNPKGRFEGKSRGESADTNDFLTFELLPEKEYKITAEGIEKLIKTGQAGSQQLVNISLKSQLASTEVLGISSAEALKDLQAALAKKPANLRELTTKPFCDVPLTKADAKLARAVIWNAHQEIIRKDRAEEIKKRILKDGQLEMPFFYQTFGKKPANGRSLWISLHGGGGTRKEVNDGQWRNQQRLYTVEEGIYLAPRAPTNSWNLWHQDHIDRLFGRLIEDLIVLEEVNPDRVYVLGYSAGGDGVYQLAPRMADYWAAAAMMAGHPNGVSLLSVRNVPFALQMGGNDSAYNRNKVAADYGKQLEQLKKNDPTGYEHFVKIYPGKGHWMNLEDKVALPWMAKFTRNPTPDKVVWKQTGVARDRFYWLAVPSTKAKLNSLVVANRNQQTIEITQVKDVADLVIRLDERMVDLDQDVIVKSAGKTLYTGRPARTIGVLLKTLNGRGDLKLMFDAEVSVDLSRAN